MLTATSSLTYENDAAWHVSSAMLGLPGVKRDKSDSTHNEC